MAGDRAQVGFELWLYVSFSGLVSGGGQWKLFG